MRQAGLFQEKSKIGL